MIWKPRHNSILVKPDVKKATDSGFSLGEEVSKPTTGIAIEGNDSIKKGQRVMFSKFGYDEALVDGEELYIISDANVKAIEE